MKSIKVGKVVNTHGLKGELKVLSSFELKNKVFVKNFIITIDNKEYKILRARDNIKHILITLENLEDINLVEHLKNKDIYINRDDLNLNENEYIMDDLIDMDLIFNDEIIGKVIDYDNSTINKVIIARINDKNIIIPLIDDFIKKIDINNNNIYVTERIKEFIL